MSLWISRLIFLITFTECWEFTSSCLGDCLNVAPLEGPTWGFLINWKQLERGVLLAWKAEVGGKKSNTFSHISMSFILTVLVSPKQNTQNKRKGFRRRPCKSPLSSEVSSLWGAQWRYRRAQHVVGKCLAVRPRCRAELMVVTCF